MPWYEDDQENLDLVSTPQAVPIRRCSDARRVNDPFSCTLKITVPSEEVPGVKSLYGPLLQWIDPAFRLLRLENQDTPSLSCSHQRNHAQRLAQCVDNSHISTQSLSVVLFLREGAENQLTANVAKRYLESPSWVFHHKIELANPKDMRTVARQNYYGSSPDLPLWTVCSVHYGNEQLRFNIFVQHFEEMKEFYRTLTGAEISASKPGFCAFDIYSQPGLDIKLSLKYSPCLRPFPCRFATLNFTVRDICYIERTLGLKLTSQGDDTWLARDPDGNNIVLSRDESERCYGCAQDPFADTTDSGQWSETSPSDDTSSVVSSWDNTFDSVSI